MKTYKEVWDTLSKVDCSEHTEDKNGLTYLSWAWAWGMFMEHCPDAQYFFSENEDHPDGSQTVHCTITIGELNRSMWLPVMSYNNKPISNPSSRDVSDNKMRCLVKCMAMFGLGHYIYAGEDLPQSKTEAKVEETKEPEKKPSKPKKSPKEEPPVGDDIVSGDKPPSPNNADKWDDKFTQHIVTTMIEWMQGLETFTEVDPRTGREGKTITAIDQAKDYHLANKSLREAIQKHKPEFHAQYAAALEIIKKEKRGA